jgi:tetratricopeptide (TPR) repeat protein
MSTLPLPSPQQSYDPAQLLLGAAEGVPLVPVEAYGPDATAMVTAVREPPVCGEWSYDDRELEEPGGTVLTAVTRPMAGPVAVTAPVTAPVAVPVSAPPAEAPAPLAAPPAPRAQPAPIPSDPFGALCERIEALASALRYAEAATALRELASLRPDAAEISLYTGVLACRRARWKDAIVPLRAAVGRLPDHAGAHYHLGEALNQCDDLPGALVAYQRATELEPTHWRALKGVGIIYDRLGKPEQAAPYYRRARDAQRA